MILSSDAPCYFMIMKNKDFFKSFIEEPRQEVRERIGYLPQELARYPSLSVFDFVNYMEDLKGIHDKKAVTEVLAQVEMHVILSTV